MLLGAGCKYSYLLTYLLTKARTHIVGVRPLLANSKWNGVRNIRAVCTEMIDRNLIICTIYVVHELPNRRVVQSDRVPTYLESQAESGKVRELIWSWKVREFCWWSGNFGSLQTKTAIFVYFSGQSSYSLMYVHSVQFVIFFMLVCLFTLSGLKCGNDSTGSWCSGGGAD